MKTNKVQSYLILLFLSVVWGSSFILMKKGLEAYTFEQVASLRILVSAFIFLPFVIQSLRKVNRKELFIILIFGLIEIGIPPFLFTFAQQYVNSSTAGILNSLTPIFTVLIGAFIYKLKFNFSKITGVIIGFLGAAMLVVFKSSEGSIIEITSAWGALIVLATFLYGFAGNILKEDVPNLSATTVMSISFVSMGIPASFILWASGFSFAPIITHLSSSSPLIGNPAVTSFLAIVVLSTFGSALSMILLSVLVKKSSALFASFSTYLIPFVAMMWGWMDGEGISYLQFLSLIMILGGILMANTGKARIFKARPKPELNV